LLHSNRSSQQQTETAGRRAVKHSVTDCAHVDSNLQYTTIEQLEIKDVVLKNGTKVYADSNLISEMFVFDSKHKVH